MLYKKLLFLILGFSLFVISYADVIIINSGGKAVTCKYGANSALPDNIFSIKKYETRFVGYEANGLLSCEGYVPFQLIAQDEVTLYLDDNNKVINTYEASSTHAGSSCQPQNKDCEVSYIVNTYYNDIMCYSYPQDSGHGAMRFAQAGHVTRFPMSKKNMLTCIGVADSDGFFYPNNKVTLLNNNGGSLWLLPYDVDYNK